MGPLWQATRDLHHKAEGHPVAKRMVDGTITVQEWADWLHALWIIHTALDPHMPACAERADAFVKDLAALLPVIPNDSHAARAFARSLDTVHDILGAAYITIGAHRRGGRVIEKALLSAGVHLPHNHIKFDDPQAVEGLINEWRDMVSLASGASRAFATLYEVMEEIESRR